MVEYKLPKLGVAGSNPVARSSGPAADVFFGVRVLVRKVGVAHFFILIRL